MPLSDRGLISAPLSFQSRAAGEVHPDNFTAPAKLSIPRSVSGWSFVLAVGVGHEVSFTAPGSFSTISRDPSGLSGLPYACGLPVASLTVGVGHPVRSVTDVRSTDARRRERTSPEGITQSFQVSLYKVEPRLCVLARNLLTKEAFRRALLDEPIDGWPEVPLVVKPSALACRAERLARAACGPDRAIIWPAGAAEGVGPSSDAGEEVDLIKSSKVGWADVLNISFIDYPWCDQPLGDQLAQPSGRLWIDFVVECAGHQKLTSAGAGARRFLG